MGGRTAEILSQVEDGLKNFTLKYLTLNDLYSSPNIVRVIKSRRLRWLGHVARMEEGRGVHKLLVGKPEGKRPLADQDVDGRII